VGSGKSNEARRRISRGNLRGYCTCAHLDHHTGEGQGEKLSSHMDRKRGENRYTRPKRNRTERRLMSRGGTAKNRSLEGINR